ncbi:MAG: orotidine-5'-phosphate decarboxylase [Chitinophagaceae bacterium]
MTRQELIQQIKRKESYLCVGLDTDIGKIPSHLLTLSDPVFQFNKAIIDATLDLCVSYKINTAFYESMGISGWESLQKTLAYIPSSHFTIADAKRGDIGNTSLHYAKTFFEIFPFDAITVAPYMGKDSVEPFLKYPGKWTILLGLTSNEGSRDFQLLPSGDGLLFEQVIQRGLEWGTIDNLMLVIGATQVDQMAHIRELAPDHFFLIPGVGAQGGGIKETSQFALNEEVGILINVSRSILYAGGSESFADEARGIAKKYQEEMQFCLNNFI